MPLEMGVVVKLRHSHHSITALASATGESTPPPPGGEAPGRRRAKPSDSIEQWAKPTVQWKVKKYVP